MRSSRPVRVRWLVGVAVVALAISLAAQAPATKASADLERRVEALLARMTIEEKLGQLQQLDGHADGRYRDEHLDLARKGLLGSTLNVRGAAQVNPLQRAAVEESRLKIPLIFAFDVIHGYRTIFPIPLGEAATWDPAAAERSAAIAAAETRASGVHWTFAPMVDIARDARWGRIAEGAGEDPYLGAAFARARVRGFQGDDYSQPDRVVACAKHWVAYGAAEAGRDYNTVDVSERTLRDHLLSPVPRRGRRRSRHRDERVQRSQRRADVGKSVHPDTGAPKGMGVRRDRRLRLSIRRRAHQSRCCGRRGGCGAPGTRRRRRHGDGQPVVRERMATGSSARASCRWRPSTRPFGACSGSSFERACSTARTPIRQGKHRRSCGPSSGPPRARLPHAQWCCSRTTAACCRWRRPRERSRSSVRSPTLATT